MKNALVINSICTTTTQKSSIKNSATGRNLYALNITHHFSLSNTTSKIWQSRIFSFLRIFSCCCCCCIICNYKLLLVCYLIIFSNNNANIVIDRKGERETETFQCYDWAFLLSKPERKYVYISMCMILSLLYLGMQQHNVKFTMCDHG